MKEGYCMKYKFANRVLSFLLAAVMVLGLIPAVATPEVEAATTEEIASQTASALENLKSQYSSLQIPQTKAKHVTNSTVGSLDGTYFMFLMARDKGAASQHRMINFDGWPASQYDRLSENCYDGKSGLNTMYLPSAWVTIGSWGTGNDTFEYMNDNRNPTNLLDYAVEFKR